eukprot:scaffold80437_cov63-Phaeocystis_antarctica.AAC.1
MLWEEGTHVHVRRGADAQPAACGAVDAHAHVGPPASQAALHPRAHRLVAAREVDGRHEPFVEPLQEGRKIRRGGARRVQPPSRRGGHRLLIRVLSCFRSIECARDRAAG